MEFITVQGVQIISVLMLLSVYCNIWENKEGA